MGYFESDAQEMLDIYLLESRQLMEQLEKVLLNGEKEGRFTEEEIHSIFRIMHTIKSSSAMMGLGGLSSLSHKLEDLFSYYRDMHGEIKEVDQELMDLLFAASDFIEEELETMTDESYVPAETKHLEKQAETYLDKITGKEEEAAAEGNTAREETPKRADPPEALSRKPGLLVRIIFENGCRMENVRAFMLARQISGMCSVVETFPHDLEKTQDCSAYIQENGVFFRIESERQEEVLKALQSGLFVDHCEIISIRSDEIKEAPKPVEEPQETKEAEFLNIKMDRLDHLQNLAAELLIQMMILDSQLERKGMEELREGPAYQLNRLIGEVDRAVMEMRLVPVSQIIPKVRRTLRDVCRSQNKEVDLEISCGDIEADKSVVEYVSEAILHLLRNAVDHGIETPNERLEAGISRKGKIIFTAESTIGELLISIQDDGCGLDEEKIKETARKRGLLTRPESEYDRQEIINFILAPGFTTNEEVTEYSGRGVGLDVVKNIVEVAGGHFYIRSEAGRGSTFTMSVPMTLATMECTRFSVGKYRFSVPARHVYRFLQYEDNKKNIQYIDGKEYILYEGRMIPFINLRKFYGQCGDIPDGAVIVYMRGTEKEACILADEMHEQKRIVVKPIPPLLGPDFKRNTGISGFSIMGNGKICAALDVEALSARYERGE